MRSVASTFSSIQLWTTVVVLILAPLVFGSVDLFWVAVWTILLSISTLCGVGVPMQTGQSRIFYAFLGVCGVYGIVSIIQVVPLGLDRLNDPSWQLADELLGLGVLPRISSRAEIPPLAAGHFLLFVTSLVVQSRGQVEWIDPEAVWFVRPDLADSFIGCEAA